VNSFAAANDRLPDSGRHGSTTASARHLHALHEDGISVVTTVAAISSGRDSVDRMDCNSHYSYQNTTASEESAGRNRSRSAFRPKEQAGEAGRRHHGRLKTIS
jgi:hypothetical protein